VLDEAHHLLPATWSPPHDGVVPALETALLVTVHPEQVAPSVLPQVDLLVAVGPAADESVDAFAKALGKEQPNRPERQEGEALVWRLPDGNVTAVRLEVPQGERQRHRRKYAEGTLGPDKSFYFTGPEHRLNLRAQNLAMFTQIAHGIDDDTWLHHLRRGDYSHWVRDAIKDDEMAEEVAAIERGAHMSVGRRVPLSSTPSTALRNSATESSKGATADISRGPRQGYREGFGPRSRTTYMTRGAADAPLVTLTEIESYQRGSLRRRGPRSSRPPPKPPERGAGGRASLTASVRPPNGRSFNWLIAFCASASVAISTKANPRARPVSRSRIIWTVSTVPACEKSS
jgi:hypothetical protein